MDTEAKDIAGKALKMILSRGANQASVRVSHAVSNSFDVSDGTLEKVFGSSESMLSLQIYSEGKYGTFSSNRISEDSLEGFIDECMGAMEFIQKSPYRRLPQKELYFSGKIPDMGIFDKSFLDTDPELKRSIAYDTYNEMKDKEGVINATSSFSDYLENSFLLDSNGFEGYSESTLSSISAECTVSDSKRRSMSYWWESSPFIKELEWKGVGEKAWQRAIEKRGAKAVATGLYDIIIDSCVSQNIIRPIIDALSGDYLANNESFLLKRNGEKVFNDKFNIVDIPWKRGKTASRLWDCDGVAQHKNNVIENGTLKYRYLNTYNAARMNVSQTVDEPSILCIEPFGCTSLINGIIVTGFNGGNCNISTGDFSYGIEGYMVKDGKKVHPICGMNFSGNIISLFNSIEGAGKEYRKCQKWEIPSLLFKRCFLSGL